MCRGGDAKKGTAIEGKSSAHAWPIIYTCVMLIVVLLCKSI